MQKNVEIVRKEKQETVLESENTKRKRESVWSGRKKLGRGVLEP